jgi:hypothetical protein
VAKIETRRKTELQDLEKIQQALVLKQKAMQTAEVCSPPQISLYLLQWGSKFWIKEYWKSQISGLFHLIFGHECIAGKV